MRAFHVRRSMFETPDIPAAYPVSCPCTALNPKSSMGTVISHRQLERIEALVQRGVGKVLAGGRRMTGTSALDGYDFSLGAFFPPTVITDVPTQDDLWREEVFGPVVVVTRFSVSSLFTFPALFTGLPVSGCFRGVTLSCALPTIPFVTADGDVVSCLFRAIVKAWNLRTRASTGSALAYGRRTSPRRTGSPPRSRLASCGSTHITAMTPVHHGAYI